MGLVYIRAPAVEMAAFLIHAVKHLPVVPTLRQRGLFSAFVRGVQRQRIDTYMSICMYILKGVLHVLQRPAL